MQTQTNSRTVAFHAIALREAKPFAASSLWTLHQSLEHALRQAPRPRSLSSDEQRAVALAFQRHVAHTYHALQFTAAYLVFTRERRNFVRSIATLDGNSRTVEPLDQERLDELHEQADQAVSAAGSEHRKTVARFCSLLKLEPGSEPRTTTLTYPPQPASLVTLLAAHDAPALAKDTAGNPAAGMTASLRPGRTVSLTTSRHDEIGARLSEHLHNNSVSASATGMSTAPGLPANGTSRADQLRENHRFLGYLIELIQHHRTHVLEHRRQLFEVARSDYTTERAGLHALAGALDAYFTARTCHLDLLTQAWMEAANMRQMSGQMLVSMSESQF